MSLFAKFAAKPITEKPNTKKIFVYGRENSGKSTFIDNLQLSTTNISPTFGYDSKTLAYNYKNVDYELKFVDIGGQKCFKDYLNNIIDDCDTLIYFIDVFELFICDSEKYKNEILEDIKMFERRGTKIYLFYNKMDLVEDIEEKYKINNYETVYGSAISGEGVKEIVEIILEQNK